MPTRKDYLDALKAEILRRYGRPGGWAADRRKLDEFMAQASRTLETAVNHVAIDGSAFIAAWHTIGMRGRPTYKALRSLPAGA